MKDFIHAGKFMFDPESRLSYFGGELWPNEFPYNFVQWEMIVLAFAVCCLVTGGVVFYRKMTTCHFPRVLSLCFGPCVFGAACSVIQFYLAHGFMRHGWSSANDPGVFVLCSSFSSHIGFYCTLVLLFLTVMAWLSWRLIGMWRKNSLLLPRCDANGATLR